MNLRFQVWLAFLLLVLLPTQFGKHFFFDFSYIDGIRVDYASLVFYITDVVSIILITLNWKPLIEFAVTIKKQLLIFIVLLFSNALVSFFPILAFYHVFRIFQLLALFVIFSKTDLSKNQILGGFLIGGIVEVVLAVLQLYKKSAIQGPFYFLGERLMSLGTPGIAKASIGGTEFLRPYATFSHPNSMAGFYFLVFMFVLQLKPTTKLAGGPPGGGPAGFSLNEVKKKRWDEGGTGPARIEVLRLVVLTISALLVFLSFSKATVVIFLLLGGTYFLKNLPHCKICTVSRIVITAISALYIFVAKTDPLSFEKRLFLIKSSSTIIRDNVLFGTGLGHYLFFQAKFTNPYSYVFLQPVHNIFLLFFAQAGFFVTIFVLYFLWRFVQKQQKNTAFMYCLAVVIATGMIDHYWLTLQQNWLLLPVIFGALKKYS